MVDSAKMANLSLSRPILSDHLSIKVTYGTPQGTPMVQIADYDDTNDTIGNINSTSLESRS